MYSPISYSNIDGERLCSVEWRAREHRDLFTQVLIPRWYRVKSAVTSRRELRYRKIWNLLSSLRLRTTRRFLLMPRTNWLGLSAAATILRPAHSPPCSSGLHEVKTLCACSTPSYSKSSTLSSVT